MWRCLLSAVIWLYLEVRTHACILQDLDVFRLVGYLPGSYCPWQDFLLQGYSCLPILGIQELRKKHLIFLLFFWLIGNSIVYYTFTSFTYLTYYFFISSLFIVSNVSFWSKERAFRFFLERYGSSLYGVIMNQDLLRFCLVRFLYEHL